MPMPDLDSRLRRYGSGLAYPDRDVWPEVARRLTRRRSWTRRLTVALAAIAVAATVAVAVAPARGALLRLLGFDGVTVVRVERLPVLAATNTVDFGRPTTLAAAQAAVPFPLQLPQERRPGTVYVGRDRPPAVTLLYGSRQRPRLVLTQFRPCCRQDSLRKEVPVGVEVEKVTVNGDRGLWIDGPHIVRTATSTRVAGSTLLWQHERVVFRLEAALERREAVALAESLRPLRD
jgi:hypothetical protein